MNREDIRIPCTTVSRVWSTAIEQTGDRYLAMNLGISRLPHANRTTELIMEASATVLESFQLAARYSTLIADVMTVELDEIDGHLAIEFIPKATWRQQPEAVQLDCLAITYVSAVSSLSRILGTHQPPTLLSLTFDTPPASERWADALGRAPRFGAAHNRIGFPAELKSESVATSDPGLKAVLRRYGDELNSTFSNERPMTGAVLSTIVGLMAPQPPSLEMVAGSLGQGRRSLQRVLRAEGTSYRSLVEQVRMDVSERHLRDGEYSVDEVARLAGYADTSSFVRAFKRCKGQPPRRFTTGRS